MLDDKTSCQQLVGNPQPPCLKPTHPPTQTDSFLPVIFNPLRHPTRVVESDHGAFVLLNVYVPNAGDRPARARLELKLSFLRALKAQMDEVVAAGREVRQG